MPWNLVFRLWFAELPPTAWTRPIGRHRVGIPELVAFFTPRHRFDSRSVALMVPSRWVGLTVLEHHVEASLPALDSLRPTR